MNSPSCLARWVPAFGAIRRGACLAAAAALAGCAPSDPAARTAEVKDAGPAIVPLRTILLQENPHAFVGHPAQLAIDSATGDLFVADMFGKRILQFTRDGALKRELGGVTDKGGHLRGLFDIVLHGSSVLAVDEKHHELSSYALATGDLEERRPFRQLQPNMFSGPGSVVWTGGFDAAQHSMLSSWDLATDRRTTIVPMSRELEGRKAWRSTWAAMATYWADSMLVSLSASNSLFIMTLDGTVLETVTIPVRRRRGVPESLLRQEGISSRDIQNGISQLFAFHRLGDGSVVLVFLENTIGAERSDWTTRLWISLINLDLHRACVDTPLEIASVSMPFPAFRADTLFVLTQDVSEGAGKSVVRAFRTDPARCAWLPTTRGGTGTEPQ